MEVYKKMSPYLTFEDGKVICEIDEIFVPPTGQVTRSEFCASLKNLRYIITCEDKDKKQWQILKKIWESGKIKEYNILFDDNTKWVFNALIERVYRDAIEFIIIGNPIAIRKRSEK